MIFYYLYELVNWYLPEWVNGSVTGVDHTQGLTSLGQGSELSITMVISSSFFLSDVRILSLTQFLSLSAVSTSIIKIISNT